MRPILLVLAILFLVTAPSLTHAQTAPVSSHELLLGIDSGYVQAAKSSRGPTVVFSTEVFGDKDPWIRLHFQNVELSGDPLAGDGSYLRITSMKDSAQQTLNANEVLQWNNTSAYFNGDAVLVELVAYPGTGPNQVSIASASLGEVATNAESICGEGDDRVPSNDPRVARIVPIGCSSFLVDEGDCSNRLLTAGHCLSGGTQIIEFNVPPSEPDGTIVHPAPRDQYPIDRNSIEGVSGGLGEDFGTFVVFPNSETGLAPRTAQGAAFHLANNVSSNPAEYWQGLRVTGYGVDNGSSNQTQQTDKGPYQGRSGNQLNYSMDTTGGNSGSPVIDPRDDKVVGIHTHGGCNNPSIGVNSGTAIDNPALVSLLDNGPQGSCEEHQFCVPHAYWYPPGADEWSDYEIIDAWYDGANCYVHHLGWTDGMPFILSNRAYYVTPGPNGVCEQGWFDGANCLLGYAPEWRTPFFWNGAFYYIE